jgi:hypothetical protein
MNGQNSGDEGAKLIIILVVIGVVAWVVLHIVFMLGVLLVVGLTAASVYYGFKLGHKVAMESEVWENRRIGKHKRLNAQREREKAYFSAQGMEQMSAVVDMHYEDKERDLYKPKNRLDDTLNLVKKVREVFKKNEARTNRN